jgi:hypothetical protein
MKSAPLRKNNDAQRVLIHQVLTSGRECSCNWLVVIEMRKKDKLILCIPGMIGAVAEGPFAIFGLLVLIALLVNNL